MTDYFSLLGELRRPWLDPESLKKKFLSLSAEVHPDRVHSADATQRQQAQQRYVELNQAYQHLRNPKERLLHLLELEQGSKPQQIQQVPPDLMEIFFEVGRLFKDADAFLAQKARTSSPLLQVQLFETAQARIENLTALQKKLTALQEQLLNELKTEDSLWVDTGGAACSDRPALLRRLEQLYRLFSYFDRWQNQIQEKIVQLSL